MRLAFLAWLLVFFVGGAAWVLGVFAALDTRDRACRLCALIGGAPGTLVAAAAMAFDWARFGVLWGARHMPCRSAWQLKYDTPRAVERGDATGVRRLEMTVEQVEALRHLPEDLEDYQAYYADPGLGVTRTLRAAFAAARAAPETRTTPLAA